MAKEEKPLNMSESVRPRKGDRDVLGVNSEIGRKLRQHYDEIAADTVPDRFMALLSQLEQAENAQKKD